VPSLPFPPPEHYLTIFRDVSFDFPWNRTPTSPRNKPTQLPGALNEDAAKRAMPCWMLKRIVQQANSIKKKVI
jgi:hypothetical protein